LETTGLGTQVYEILKKLLFDPKILLGSAFLDYVRHTNTSNEESDVTIVPDITLEGASDTAAFTVKLDETVLRSKHTLKQVVKDRFVVRAGEAIVDLYLAFGLMIPIPTKLQEEESNIYNVLTTNFDAILAEEAGTSEGAPWSNIPAAVLVVVWLTCHGNRFGSSGASGGRTGDLTAKKR
jgi:hypothetical protein